MNKRKTNFTCSACGATATKWQGRCSDCGQWNCMVETAAEPSEAGSHRYASWTGSSGQVIELSAAKGQEFERHDTGLGEFNRVLGGGLVPGSVVLIGGDPGIGKSTLLLQVLASMGSQRKVLYATGEESTQQVALRAERLGLGQARVQLVAEIELEKILNVIETQSPALVVIDSIQTLYSSLLQSAPGTVAQVRECAAHLTRVAKSKGIGLIFVGHVTKEGTLAGPRVLEHMVDTVLYFEGEPGSAYRMVRAWKNRFGSANELGVFCMGEQGLEEVTNPSSMFLGAHDAPVSGTCILGALEGNRPFLVEVQALVESAPTPNPKRYASGVDTSRLQMLLAVLAKHAGLAAHDQNVYVKVVGGVRLTEPAADLAVLLAAHSSLVCRAMPEGLIVFGEVGLAGELRAVADAQTRLKEAAKLGFRKALIPAQCKLQKPVPGIEVTAVARVDQAIAALREIRDTV